MQLKRFATKSYFNANLNSLTLLNYSIINNCILTFSYRQWMTGKTFLNLCQVVMTTNATTSGSLSTNSNLRKHPGPMKRTLTSENSFKNAAKSNGKRSRTRSTKRWGTRKDKENSAESAGSTSCRLISVENHGLRKKICFYWLNRGRSGINGHTLLRK